MKYMKLSKNYKAIVSYDGSRYNGWQRQGRGDNTIQGKLESVLEQMSGESIEINGSGRTDAGVHAKGQVINFHLTTEQTPREIETYLNHYLPKDIAVKDVEVAEPRFHSRLSAKRKIYRYHIWLGKENPVFARKYVYVPKEQEIDVAAMKEAAKQLLGTHDFKGFSSLKKVKKSTIRTIYRIEFFLQENELVIEYEGDGFLYHMVRILTGTLLEAGAGKRSINEVKKALETLNREDAGYTVPPEGLFLEKVIYEDSRNIM